MVCETESRAMDRRCLDTWMKLALVEINECLTKNKIAAVLMDPMKRVLYWWDVVARGRQKILRHSHETAAT